ncbi:hypothetical protein ACEWY4_012337 [Coilia grayii]|uniref:Tripartite motif-containing protein 16-like n=1 Tax=Coilia grayii TaxID=363190 RepID=A0ABD1K070_9TELE
MADIFSNDQYFLACAICLDVLQVPVTIPCGHSYCFNCIKRYFDQREDLGEPVQCPQCWETFASRPALNKNTLIAEMVEKIQEPKPTAASRGIHAETKIECDVCTGTKVKAVKSCLVCLVSYCEPHLKLHNELNPGGKHKVVNPAGQLKDKLCRRHGKLLEVFCRTDQQILCVMCTMGEHRGHEMVPAEVERNDKQKLLGNTDNNSKRLQEKEEEYQQVKTAMETVKRSAAAAVADNDTCYKYLIGSIEKRHAKVTQLIKAQEKAEVRRAKGVLKQLDEEISELRRRDAELEQLSDTDDHIHFLQRFPFLNGPCGSDVLIQVNRHVSFGEVGSSLFALKRRLDSQWVEEEKEMTETVKHVQALVLPDYSTKEDFLKYFHPFGLDPATVRNDLQLSQGNRRVTDSNVSQSYPYHPERFDCWLQVLCTEGISARSYWEAEWKGHWANIALAYRSISRNGGGKESRFGSNNKSWSLRLNSSSSSLWHDDKETRLSLVASSRIGVYVDYRAGTLSFYSISDAMTLLHRVQTTFTETLYPGFGFDFGLTHHPSSVEFVEPLCYI